MRLSFKTMLNIELSTHRYRIPIDVEEIGDPVREPKSRQVVDGFPHVSTQASSREDCDSDGKMNLGFHSSDHM